MKNLRASAAAIALAVAAACGGGSTPAATPASQGKRVDAAKAGTVNGRVLFEGTAPDNAAIKMAADPYCEAAHPGGATFQTFAVKDGGLDNVFVYVKDGLDGYAFDVPTDPVTLAQDGCLYSPHVFGIRVGQPLLIVNNDSTIHNVHAVPGKNDEFNLSQQMQGMKATRTFTAPEVLVPFKCDVHSWMSAYAGVVATPYFAVTHDGGQFELAGLPPGTYTIEAVHERLGPQTTTVTIGDNETKAVSFTFKPAAS